MVIYHNVVRLKIKNKLPLLTEQEKNLTLFSFTEQEINLTLFSFMTTESHLLLTIM